MNLDSPLLKIINDYECDVVVLHWVNAELLSCRDIARIRHKLIWMFHDLGLYVASEPIRILDYLNKQRRIKLPI